MDRAHAILLLGVAGAAAMLLAQDAGAVAVEQAPQDSGGGGGFDWSLPDWLTTDAGPTLQAPAQSELDGYMAPADMDKNLQAFLLMIRVGEGTQGEIGYRTMFGGGTFSSFADHPRQAITRSLGGKPITSTAAGAYQFLSTTWDECRRALNLPDFSPASQDAAAVYLIRRRGALADVQAGRFVAACNKLSYEWASLPPGRYGQPIQTFAQAEANYQRFGGTLA